MKFYTHPSLTYSFIRYKDGSSYFKHWRYLRPTLILEGDQKNWDERSSQMSHSATKSHKLIASQQHLFTTLPQSSNALNRIQLTNTANSFWV